MGPLLLLHSVIPLKEREAELAAVEVRVRRIAVAVEELKPPPRIGAA